MLAYVSNGRVNGKCSVKSLTSVDVAFGMKIAIRRYNVACDLLDFRKRKAAAQAILHVIFKFWSGEFHDEAKVVPIGSPMPECANQFHLHTVSQQSLIIVQEGISYSAVPPRVIWNAVIVAVIEGLHRTELLRGVSSKDLYCHMLLLDNVSRPPHGATSSIAYFASYEISTTKNDTDSDGVKTAFAVLFDIFGWEVRFDIFAVCDYGRVLF